MTSEHAPNIVNAGTVVSCHEGTTGRGKHEVSGKCCCNQGNAVVIGGRKIFKNFLTTPPTPQYSIPLQMVADDGTEKNRHCSKKEILKIKLQFGKNKCLYTS